MIDRINRHYQFPTTPEMVNHFRNEIGLVGKNLEIFDDLRNTTTDTSGHAQNVGLPVKTYNELSANVSKRCFSELVRLAEIGLKAEQNQEGIPF